ncbi:MAG: aldo/keto reductase [Lachnospiraceae bacterium]|nr:aldo/keto reductase [Lachnospiraceae bacterium]
MSKIRLGRSSMEVSRTAVGCMRMNALTESEADRFVKGALEMGLNFFDHADIYGGGDCESLFGKVLNDNPGLRENMIIQSKAGICPGVMYDNSKEHLIKAVDQMLQRLHTEYLDVFLIHRPDALMEPEEVAEAFDALQTAGKVRWFGVSNHKPMQIELLSSYIRQELLVDQLQLSITNSNMVRNGMEVNMETEGAVDRDGSVLDYCRLKGITIQTWSPFQYGMFEGVFLGNSKFAALNEVIDEIAGKYGVSNTTVAAAWIFRHPAKMQILSGTMKLSRLQEICRAEELVLTREEWYRIYLAAGHILP